MPRRQSCHRMAEISAPPLKRSRKAAASCSTSASSGDEAPWVPELSRPPLQAAAEKALHSFDRVFVAYLQEYHDRDDKAARRLAEQLVPALYEELCVTVGELRPWTGGEENQVRSKNAEYVALEFCGEPHTPELAPQDEEKILTMPRQQSTTFMARNALLAALAVLSSRSEQGWLDSFDFECEWRFRQQSAPRVHRQKLFETVLRNALNEQVHGHFVTALLHPTSNFRVAFTAGEAAVPASLLLTYQVSLCDAFRLMDDGGPLCGSCDDWQRWPQFALQELLQAPVREGPQRQLVGELQPEPAIRDLVCSGAKVVHLDAFACLAPRAEARLQGLGSIVKEELARMLQEAKMRGQAVVFMLGGDDCHSLARKVYLKPPFTDFGLRIGYLRWKTGDSQSWAREKRCHARICIGLQLP